MKYVFFFLLGLLATPLAAQQNTLCGNGDFESGVIDPGEWTGYYATSDCGCADPVFTQSPANALSGPITSSSAHLTIVNNTVDPNILALATVPPAVAPNPPLNQYSLRIGNDTTGCGHEKIAKTFVVDPADPELRFWYASVMQNPGSNHHCDTTGGGDLGRVPGFGVFLFDQSGTDISHLVDLGDGSNFNFFAASNNFFQQASSGIYYTDWRCVCVNLRDYINQTVTVEFYNRDCRAGIHYGYSYIDNLCLGCYGSSTGSLTLAPDRDTCGLPGQLCIDYTLPYLDSLTTGDCQIDLTILQNGAPLVVLSSPLLTDGNQYCFDLNTVNLAALNAGLGGFDFFVEGEFSITEDGNTTLTYKTIGTEPDGILDGQHNDYLLACPNQCDKLSIAGAPLPNNGQCCYAIDLTNDLGPEIAYVEANLVSSDWVFATGATPGPGFGWLVPPGPNSLPVTVNAPGGGVGIPDGLSAGALTFCLEPTVADPALPQTVVFTWYAGAPGSVGYRPVCYDTLSFNCRPEVIEDCLTLTPQVNCSPDNPYEYLVTFTVTNHSDFTATHLVLDNLINPVDFGLSACDAADHLASIAIPLSPPLDPGATSGPLCVKIRSADPVLSATTLELYAGLITPEECCTNEEQVSLILQPCCDPCGDIRLVDYPLPAESECCFTLDIENDCAYQFFKKVETVILTPGVQFGYHALGGPNAGDWNIGASTATSILWELNGNAYIPPGTTMDLMQFCLDGIDEPAQVPQLVQVNWITEDQNGGDSIACSDILEFNCAPVVDYNCLVVTDPVLECVPDSSLYCYTFTVTNTSDIPFAATNLDLFEVSDANVDFTGGGGTFPLPPLGQGDSIRLTTCFVSDPFPLSSDSTLVFQYRLRYLMGDTCCYESRLDTLEIPECFPDTIPHDCCYPAFIQMPTGLSPNGDGLNDRFVIRGIDNCQKVTLTVFNRWGNVVFQREDYDNTWDGTNQDGEPLPQGTYYLLLALHDSGSSVAGFVDLRRY